MTRPVWQARRSSLRGTEGERGAVATLVAVLLAGGVIIGMLALSIDVGNIMWERRQLQNGADAASLALAQTCAKDATKCAPGAVTDLTPLVNANAADGLQQFDTHPGTVNGLCARGANSAGLPVCASATSTADVTALADCPPLPTWLTGAAGSATKYVEVYTRTRSTAADDTILPGFFSQALVGAPQASVSACARAAWGPAGPTNAIVLPLVISECDWKAQTGYTGPGTAVYPAAPQGAWPGYDNLAGSTRPWPAASVQHAVYSKGNPTPCDTSSPGGTAPGGFAWLDTIPHANCLAQVSSGWAHGDTGADVECSYTELSQYWGRTVMVPVFDCLTSAPVTITSSTNCNSGVGNNTYYHISGYASFYLSGWWLNPNKHASVRPPGGYQCGNPDRCLFGWFTQDLVEDAPIVPPPPGGTPNYGLTSVQPAG
ncbi:MAG: TadE/TadG family type IV pilus assembly protein [Dermatophilaceae bacterium]